MEIMLTDREHDPAALEEYMATPVLTPRSSITGWPIRRLGALLLASCALIGGSAAAGPTVAPTQGPAANGQPAWRLLKAFSNPPGRLVVEAGGAVTVVPPDPNAPPAPPRAASGLPPGRFPGCVRSPICGRVGALDRSSITRVTWDQAPGYTFSYPFKVPGVAGGVPGVTVDSKGNVWASQRSPRGAPQLHKFAPDGKLLFSVSPEVIGYIVKAHAIAVDPQDNVWISDETGARVVEVSPDGKLLRTMGTAGKPGDWDEAKGQRLLWEPVSIGFGPTGDLYIGEGHGNESPNVVDSDDPTNNIGAARILHFDKDGKFINQWFGNDLGLGKFEQTHGMNVDPVSGEVWIGDREQYRIVVYTGDGHFLRTMNMRNLICAIAFDKQGNPWVAAGMDGQVLKLSRDGKVIAAAGAGQGIDKGKFVEAGFLGFDKTGAAYVGDTGLARITKISPPLRRK
jgi:sugar lactone lactonase YvrE